MLSGQAKISWTRLYNDEWAHDGCYGKRQRNTTTREKIYDHVFKWRFPLPMSHACRRAKEYGWSKMWHK